MHAPALHVGVAPLHVTPSTHAPPVHVCVVVVVPGLHRLLPSVHTLHAPAEHVPLSVPVEHAVPSGRLPIPHAPPVHVAVKHGFSGAVHCVGLVHCTQVTVVESQYGVAAAHVTAGSYFPLELQVKYPLAPLHTLLPGVHALQTPAPSHVPPGHADPAAFGAKPHVFAVHVADKHGLVVGGHCVAAVHCTQVTDVASQ